MVDAMVVGVFCLVAFLMAALDAHFVTTPPKKPHVPLNLTEEEEAELFDLPWNWEDTPLPKKKEIG